MDWSESDLFQCVHTGNVPGAGSSGTELSWRVCTGSVSDYINMYDREVLLQVRRV